MKGPKPKPDDEKMVPETIRLMRKTRRKIKELATAECIGVGKWMRTALEQATTADGLTSESSGGRDHQSTGSL